MLASFEPQDLPGVHPSRLFPLMDIGSYREAWTAVRGVSSNCISPFLTANRTIDFGASNFVSETGYSDFGMCFFFRPILCDFADDWYALKGREALLVSFCGLQILLSAALRTQSTPMLRPMILPEFCHCKWRTRQFCR